jgi:putative ABC transport system permease protein
MLRNYLMAALHNLKRNKLYAGLNIGGLGVGFAAAILIGLFVRDEYSYDRFLPDKERVYMVTLRLTIPGQSTVVDFAQDLQLASFLKLDFPEVAAVGRLFPERGAFRFHNVDSNEAFFWADPDILTVLKFPVAAGYASADSLRRPDSVVITSRIAHKYFGRENVVGEILQLNRSQPLEVAAVLKDFPPNTHFSADIMVSGGASYSRLKSRDDGVIDSSADDVAYTYIKLKPNGDIQRLLAMRDAFIARHYPPPPGAKSDWIGIDFVPITDVHLYPAFDGMHKLKPSVGGSRTLIMAMTLIGALIVSIAGINFVNLMTARSARRAIEVGVRKSSGARRRDLMVQFLGESLLYAAFGLLAATLFVIVLLPHFNAFLDRQIEFNPLLDPTLLLCMVAAAAITGILAGIYPAVVISSFRPVVALKGKGAAAMGSGKVRYALVIMQFAILTTLILATSVIFRQTAYAMRDGMRLNTDQVLLVKTSCTGTFPEEVRRLPGVRSATCANGKAMRYGWNGDAYVRDNGTKTFINEAAVDYDFFVTYGLHPVAGRFFSREHGGDIVKVSTATDDDVTNPVVLNELAAAKLGYVNPRDAIGAVIRQENGRKAFEVIGVAPDYSIDPIHEPVRPFVFNMQPNQYEWLSIKLKGGDNQHVLNAIDTLWYRVGEPHPIERSFFEQHLKALSTDVERQAQTLSIFAVVTIVIACLGMFGLSAFTAERRTKEIGIRKAMGAQRRDILKLLLWQFAKPVLWANLLAWPVGYLIMNYWLEGFVAHIDLELWMFIAASASAMAVALLTVSVHAYKVAGTQPIGSLRYE